MSTNAEESNDGDEKKLETGAVGGGDFAKRTSPAKQSLFATVSGDSGVLPRQGIMNSHVKDTQFFMVMAGEGLFSRSHPLSMVSERSTSAGEDRMEQRLQAGPLLDLCQSSRPMGLGRPFDDDGRSLLLLFHLIDDVNRATRGYSHAAGADEASQQENRLREADDVRRCFVRQ